MSHAQGCCAQYLQMLLMKADTSAVFRTRRTLRDKGLEVPLMSIAGYWLMLHRREGGGWASFESKIGSLDRLESLTEFSQLCTASLVGILDEIRTREDIGPALERYRVRRQQQVKDAGGEGYDPQVVQKALKEAVRFAYRRGSKPVLLRDLASSGSVGAKETAVIRLFHKEWIDVDGTATPTKIVLKGARQATYLTPRQVLLVLAIGLPLAGLYVWHQDTVMREGVEARDEARNRAASQAAQEMQRRQDALIKAVETYTDDPSAANARDADQKQRDLLDAARKSVIAH